MMFVLRLQYLSPRLFAQTDHRLQDEEVEECVSCDVQILNKPLLPETSTPKDPEFTNAPSSPGSQLCLSPLLLQSNYCPQSAVLPCDTTTHQQVMSVTNRGYLRGYLSTDVEHPSEAQEATVSEITPNFEPSAHLQDSCVVLCGYV